jgi:PAS domain S-box-containing protein
MDMERLKQNLRLRSSRSKQTSKKFPTTPSGKKAAGPTQEKELPHRPDSQPQQEKTVSAQPESDSPSLRNWDQDTALPQKQTQQNQRESEQSPKPQQHEHSSRPAGARSMTVQNQSTRYGRSGIERSNTQPPVEKQEQRKQQEITMKQPSKESDRTPSSDEQDFDLRPTPSKPRPTSMDTLCEMLFSSGHLNILLHDPQLMTRFSTFLQRYKPELSAIVLQYLEYQKAIKAIEYANAVAQSIAPIAAIQDVDGSRTPTQEDSGQLHSSAAELSKPFAETSQRAYDLLVHEALPAYITYTLVKLSTECLIAEITSSAPTSLTANLIGGLSEVFCLSDPNLPGNPLIYCSEEFYRLTGYTSGDVLGRNCRFLQGHKTDKNTIRRIRDAVTKGDGCNEVVLNYRRDGRGFVNVLMISPLEDDKGKVKYFLGAQIDVSRLVAGGWGLEGLERLVQKRELEEMRGRRVVKSKKDEALRKLRELSEMFDMEESAIVRSHSRSSSMDRGEIASGATSAGGSDRPRQARRVFGDDGEEGSGSDDDSDTATEETQKEKSAWKLTSSGTSGKLPGVYQSYALIRPAPSLRIIFVSPALRKKSNVSQKPFLSHIAAPAATLSGLKDSFTSGTPVTAKVAFMSEPGSTRDGTATGRWRRTNSKSKNEQNEKNDKDPSTLGRTCWISATPLLGSDEEVGVWMVVFVDKNSAPGRTLSRTKGQGMRHQQLEGRAVGIAKAGERNEQIQALSNDIRKDDLPIKPVRVGGTSVNGTPRRTESPSPPEDREAAREMYDNNGNEAVQREASQDVSKSTHGNTINETNSKINNHAVEEKSSSSNEDERNAVNKGQPTDDTGPSENGQPKDEAQKKDEIQQKDDTKLDGNQQLEHNTASKDDADFEKVPKANSSDYEGSGPGPTEEQDDEHYTDPEDEPQSPRDVIAAKQLGNNESDSDTFVRRHSRPLTPNTKERVVIRSDSSSDVEREAGVDAAAIASFPGKHDADEEQSTPTRAKHQHQHEHQHPQSDEGYEEGEGSRPGTSTSRAPLYMDYLRHPGTREQRKKRREGEATPSDPDCEVWSPYSVD